MTKKRTLADLQEKLRRHGRLLSRSEVVRMALHQMAISEPSASWVGGSMPNDESREHSRTPSQAVRPDYLTDLAKQFEQQREVLLEAVRPDYLTDLAKQFEQQREVLLEAVRPDYLTDLAKQFEQQREVLLEAVRPDYLTDLAKQWREQFSAAVDAIRPDFTVSQQSEG